MINNLKNKVIVVTGASSGIGRATARNLAASGAIVIAVARNYERLKELQDETIKSNGIVSFYATDISIPENISNLIQSVMNQHKRIDGWINNAGFGILCFLEELPYTEFQNILNTNLLAPYQSMKQLIPIMRDQGGGVIINISSVIGRRGVPYYSAYCATKFALIGMTESVRAELGNSSPVKVCIVNPGLTNTNFGKHISNPSNLSIENNWIRGASPDKVSKTILKCLANPKPEYYVSWFDHLFIIVNTLFPSLISWGLRHYRRVKS